MKLTTSKGFNRTFMELKCVLTLWAFGSGLGF